MINESHRYDYFTIKSAIGVTACKVNQRIKTVNRVSANLSGT